MSSDPDNTLNPDRSPQVLIPIPLPPTLLLPTPLDLLLPPPPLFPLDQPSHLFLLFLARRGDDTALRGRDDQLIEFLYS